jgi:hypothetical protein
MNVALFEGAGIQVHYLDYAGYPEYPQLYPPFLHGTCIWDLIFNVGEDTLSFMKQKDYAKR